MIVELDNGLKIVPLKGMELHKLVKIGNNFGYEGNCLRSIAKYLTENWGLRRDKMLFTNDALNIPITWGDLPCFIDFLHEKIENECGVRFKVPEIASLTMTSHTKNILKGIQEFELDVYLHRYIFRGYEDDIGIFYDAIDITDIEDEFEVIESLLEDDFNNIESKKYF